MRKAFVSFLAAITLCCGAVSAEDFPSRVEVNGECERELYPNEIYLSITLDEGESKSRVSVESQEKDMIRALQKMGIDPASDLQVSDMSSDLKTYMLRKNRIQATKSYQLKLTSAEQVAAVFDAFSALGISDVRVTKATRSDLSEIRSEMRAEAVRNARDTARTLAEAIGQSIGDAFLISDNYFSGGTTYTTNLRYAKSMVMADGMVEAAEEMPELEFKKLKYQYSVSVRFVLNPSEEGKVQE